MTATRVSQGPAFRGTQLSLRTGQGSVSPRESCGLVAVSPDMSWWLHVLTCRGGSVPTVVVTLSPDVFPGGIMFPPHVSLSPLSMSQSPLCVPISSVCPCLPPRCGKFSKVLGLCPAGCPRVPQGVTLALRMIVWLHLMLVHPTRPSIGRSTPRHPGTPHDIPRYPLSFEFGYFPSL